MDQYLGLLLAGGRGTRLGRISRFVSKAFVPVVDRPVFEYGLALLRASRRIGRIVVLANTENAAAFRGAGFDVVVQDDNEVRDIFSGWRYVRDCLAWAGGGVLMPCDNVSDVAVDEVITALEADRADVAFSLFEVADRDKLANMGVFDPASGSVRYRPQLFVSNLGVIAPYAVRAGFEPPRGAGDADVFNGSRTAVRRHEGFWYDIGDPASLVACICGLAAVSAAREPHA